MFVSEPIQKKIPKKTHLREAREAVNICGIVIVVLRECVYDALSNYALTPLLKPRITATYSYEY